MREIETRCPQRHSVGPAKFQEPRQGLLDPLKACIALLLGATTCRPSEYRLGPFAFRGPPGLGQSSEEDRWHRRDPIFEVYLADADSAARALGSYRRGPTEERIGGERALRFESSNFAPGHGGRDHYVLVFLSKHGDGLQFYYRSHEEDHDAGWAEDFEAWRCRSWVSEALRSLRRVRP